MPAPAGIRISCPCFRRSSPFALRRNGTLLKFSQHNPHVIPAQAGIHAAPQSTRRMDSGLRRNDGSILVLYINDCKENSMWRKIADWYGKWEDEQIAVLERPELAAGASGYRRYFYLKLAQRSPVERQQLREFSLAYKGWRGWLATAKVLAVFTLLGVLLHLLVPGKSWLASLATGYALGFSLFVGAFGAWFNYRRLVNHKFKLLVTVVLSALVGGVAASGGLLWISDQSSSTVLEQLPRMLALISAVGLAIALPLLAIGFLRNRQHELLTAQLQRDAERDRMARELAESQLRLLRAQIEPHFLFNTLGAVQQLADHGAPRAAELTGHLIAFLRASMSEMRSEQVRLDAEFGLVEAYLKVMQFRLGQRLRFTLALAPELGRVQVPSMILLTLVENAIKHGIEPALRGGEIAVSAEAHDGALRIRVRDSGVGMATEPGTGTGLDNVRRRLQLAYGALASLELSDADPGVIADITIPLPPR
jgi:sensor histidine kinase YesM